MATQVAYERKFRNYFLNPKFQFKLLSFFIGIFLITTASLYSTTFLFFWRLEQKALNVGIPSGHVFFKFLSNQKANLDLMFVLLVVFNLLLLLGVGLVVSHRIAGPMFKLKRHLKNLTPESEDFTLRDGDFFRDMEPVVDELRGKLK